MIAVMYESGYLLYVYKLTSYLMFQVVKKTMLF